MTTLHDVRSPAWAAASTTGAPVVLLLHGYGSHEHDLAVLAPALAIEGRWASLRAPLDMPGGGAAWMPITTPGRPDPDAVAQATDAIWAWVEENVDDGSSIVPIGFSQGGVMASQLLRTRPERVAATVILGGFVLAAPQPADDVIASSRPPVFWGRGTEDRVIAEHAVAHTSEWLPGHSSLTERVYPGLAHGIHADELADVRAFLDSQTTA
ncbi:phospholipase/carboxylesterase [Labedella gwakjiensis]|uniref:Esterase n=1 Tax=Labedella gwakjiensis TaxID=390269 RepID=A0A2P8GYY6_9MICO|nr:alpha/beta fold hydrolase [Labedella gwakjiensis]PSL39178.1 phospholipase/carboxylesterase [Labedella gwakjiensis]RUQ86390.1 esterase [Labedella gwakjiensis]